MFRVQYLLTKILKNLMWWLSKWLHWHESSCTTSHDVEIVRAAAPMALRVAH